MEGAGEPFVAPPPPDYADLEGTPSAPPPQAPGYPPQGYDQGYVPQPQAPGYEQGYVPPPYPPQQQQQQQQPYPPQQYPPPTYPQQGYTGYAPPAQMQQQQQTTIVVTQQPSGPVYTRRNTSRDNYLTLSILLTCLCFFCGTWWALLCTIPAIFYALKAKEAERNGYEIHTLRYRRAACRLNLSACTTYIIAVVIVGIYCAIRFAVINQ